jgi:predicted nucleic acid-binding protein
VTAPVFVDTNVLLYVWDARDPVRQHRAVEWLSHLWESRRGRTSIQVLSEFYVAATRKLRPALPMDRARLYAATFLAWSPVASDAALLEEGWRLEERYRLSWWDALIVAAGHRAGCRQLLTEDFQSQQDFDGLTVANPFSTAPGT